LKDTFEASEFALPDLIRTPLINTQLYFIANPCKDFYTTNYNLTSPPYFLA
jgi:hypothetical protein